MSVVIYGFGVQDHSERVVIEHKINKRNVASTTCLVLLIVIVIEIATVFVFYDRVEEGFSRWRSRIRGVFIGKEVF